MKKIIYICAAAWLVFSCSDNAGDNTGGSDGPKGLVLASRVADLTDGTRAAGTDFFSEGYSIDVTLTTLNDPTEQEFEYVFGSDGLFTGDPPFYFTMDDSYITNITALWPSQEIRDQGLITDQRELDNFRRADWLTAQATSVNIMPTDAPVPLYFERQNTMIEFEIAGQNAEGIDIEYLIIELQVQDTPTAFFAYCGDPNGHAMLILDGTVELASTESYLIGRMRVTNNYEYTIIFPATDIELDKGKRYLITLTSQGYDVDNFVYIGTFNQDENSGVGIPFVSPDTNADGNFVINQPEQLITMSYLIRHYPHPDTYVWTDSTYVIADGFVMPEDMAALYIPIPRSGFNGKIISESNTDIDSVAVSDGSTLDLYE